MVRTLFRKFVSLDEFQDYHFEVLQEYLDNLDESQITDSDQRKWWTLFKEFALGTDLDSLYQSSKFSRSVQETKEGEHTREMAQHKLSSNVQIPSYDGTYGGATVFVAKFKRSMNYLRFPPADQFSLLFQNVKGNAFGCVNRNIDIIGEDVEAHYEKLIGEFDHYDVDEEMDYFMNTFRQRHNEMTKIFKQRYDSKSDKLIMLGKLSSFKENQEKHREEQSLYFYQKLNSTVKAHVSKRLKEQGKKQADMTVDQIFELAMEIESKKPLGNVNSKNGDNPSATFTHDRRNGKRNGRYQREKGRQHNVRKCYYCDSTQHMYKDKNGNKICPDAKANKEPCQNQKK